MELDFTGLNNIALSEAQRDFTDLLDEIETLEAPESNETEIDLEEFSKLWKSPKEDQREAQRDFIGDRARVSLQREQEEHKRLQEAYREQQTNILRAGELRADILKGVKAGEPAQLLLLKAVECIAKMTGDTLFYSQTEKDLKAIYGEALLQKEPLELELKGVEDRLKKLKEARARETTEEESRYSIETAIKAHERKKGELEKLLERAS